MPMSLNRFFKEFVSDKATFGFDVFSKEVMNVAEQNIEKLREFRDKAQGYPIFTRKMTGVVPITGVPFCSQSGITKDIKILRPRP